MERGFSTKSKAPSLVARTAVSMLPCPEIITTIGVCPVWRIRSRVSRPSIFGSHTSSRTRSTLPLESRARHSSPLPTDSTVYPSSARMEESESRMPASSSTMRMDCAMDFLCRSAFRYRRGDRFGRGEFDDEPRAHRSIVLRANQAVVLGDDPAGDSQSESRAALLGGEMRQEELVLVL